MVSDIIPSFHQAAGSVYAYTRPDNQTISLGCYPAGYMRITSLLSKL